MKILALLVSVFFSSCFVLHVIDSIAYLLGFTFTNVQPGAAYVSQTLTFKLPVYVGDEVLAEVQATYLRQYKNKYMSDTTLTSLISELCFTPFVKNLCLLLWQGEVYYEMLYKWGLSCCRGGSNNYYTNTNSVQITRTRMYRYMISLIIVGYCFVLLVYAHLYIPQLQNIISLNVWFKL